MFKKKTVYNLSAEFDIEGIDVFSIERIGSDTVFGYTRNGLDIEYERYIETTDEQHISFVNRLTNKFRERAHNADQVS